MESVAALSNGHAEKETVNGDVVADANANVLADKEVEVKKPLAEGGEGEESVADQGGSSSSGDG